MNDIDDQMPKEFSTITRLKKLLSVFNAYYSRGETVKNTLPTMSTSVANIIRDAKVIEAGLGHIREGHFDSQELSNEFAHLVTFAVNLPVTIEGDGDFWGYALNLVDLATFREGAEYCDIQQIDNLLRILNEVRAIKIDIRDAGADDS